MGNHDSGASAGGVLAAFLSGMTLGAVAVLLLAPQTGRESRETLARLARQAGEDMRDFSERATNTWDDVVHKSREALHEAGDIVKEAVDAGRDAIHQVRQSAPESSKTHS